MNKTLGENTIYQILMGLTTIFFRRTECSFFVHNTMPYIPPRPDFNWLRQFRLLLYIKVSECTEMN